jgi:ethanolamine utilization protein EutN
MKLGKVIGRVVATRKIDCFKRQTMLLVQGIDENLQNIGDPLVAIDIVKAGEGDIIYYEAGKEAGFALDMLSTSDATIIAIVEDIDLEGGSL